MSRWPSTPIRCPRGLQNRLLTIPETSSSSSSLPRRSFLPLALAASFVAATVAVFILTGDPGSTDRADDDPELVAMALRNHMAHRDQHGEGVLADTPAGLEEALVGGRALSGGDAVAGCESTRW